MSSQVPEPLPAYAYVPGGPWPHPNRSASSAPRERTPPIEHDAWEESKAYLRGVELFNAGYYWEAHEAWESLWHAHGRRGPTATLLKGLIKLAAAGVKIREGRVSGARSLAKRAADHFAEALLEAGSPQLGLKLDHCIEHAHFLADAPPVDPKPPGSPVSRVFSFNLAPNRNT